MVLLERLSSELLTEAKATKNAPTKKVARLLAQIESIDYTLYLIYSQHTLWVGDLKGEDQSAAVAPAPDGENIIFHYNPQVWGSYDYGTILFLLLHELGHILREHHSRASAHTKDAKYYHQIMNISMDTWINEDIKQGRLGKYEYTPKPPFSVFSESKGKQYGPTVDWVNKQIEEKTKTNPGLEYKGTKTAEDFYDWIVEKFTEYGILDNDEDEDNNELPEVGDIIRGPNNTYGEVVEVDDKVRKIRKLTKDEAYRKVREAAGMELPESILSKMYLDLLNEEGEEMEVEWTADEVTILKSSLGQEQEGGEPGEGGSQSGNTEDIDQSDEGESGGSEGGDGGDSESQDDGEIKVGDVIQDMDSGKYGRVTAIDGEDIFMDPISDEELKEKGYKAMKYDDGETIKVGNLNWGAGIEKYI